MLDGGGQHGLRLRLLFRLARGLLGLLASLALAVLGLGLALCLCGRCCGLALGLGGCASFALEPPKDRGAALVGGLALGPTTLGGGGGAGLACALVLVCLARSQREASLFACLCGALARTAATLLLLLALGLLAATATASLGGGGGNSLARTRPGEEALLFQRGRRRCGGGSGLCAGLGGRAGGGRRGSVSVRGLEAQRRVERLDLRRQRTATLQAHDLVGHLHRLRHGAGLYAQLCFDAGNLVD